MTISDIAFVLMHLKPTCFVKEMAPNRFAIVPLSALWSTSCWQYVFVNKDIKMYKVTFFSIDEIVETVFKAKEICYGHYPEDAKPNPLYGKSIEQLKIEEELTGS